ncbi:MAG TPA: ATP-binding protein [Acidimicrobiia bacterium]|nr:ATP-binding protein [Acidimicrobiia bacterium]
MTVEIRYSLRLPRDVVTVPLVRTICRDAMDRLGVTADCQGDVALALTEACANVVQHAGGVNDYEVLVEITADTCHIRVVDQGAGIDLTDSTRTEMILDDDGGRGIVLMRLLVDRIAFESRPEDGTIVHLQKRLELQEGALLTALEAAS